MSDEQRAFWNGPAAQRWVTQQESLDRALHGFGHAALEFADVLVGERVLDVGCGCGTQSLQLAERVGAAGSVTGVDLSAPMLQRARERSAGDARLHFVEADASAYRDKGGPFDLVFSRFGVMFFADPAAAFAQLRQQLAPAGRLTFVCWRAFEDNAWARVPLEVVQQILSAGPLEDPVAPGPYAFADRERLHGHLSRAGFNAIEIQRFDTEVVLGETLAAALEFILTAGPAARALLEATPDQVAQAHALLTPVLQSVRTERGQYALAGSTWLVRARS